MSRASCWRRYSGTRTCHPAPHGHCLLWLGCRAALALGALAKSQPGDTRFWAIGCVQSYGHSSYSFSCQLPNKSAELFWVLSGCTVCPDWIMRNPIFKKDILRKMLLEWTILGPCTCCSLYLEHPCLLLPASTLHLFSRHWHTLSEQPFLPIQDRVWPFFSGFPGPE